MANRARVDAFGCIQQLCAALYAENDELHDQLRRTSIIVPAATENDVLRLARRALRLLSTRRTLASHLCCWEKWAHHSAALRRLAMKWSVLRFRKHLRAWHAVARAAARGRQAARRWAVERSRRGLRLYLSTWRAAANSASLRAHAAAACAQADHAKGLRAQVEQLETAELMAQCTLERANAEREEEEREKKRLAQVLVRTQQKVRELERELEERKTGAMERVIGKVTQAAEARVQGDTKKLQEQLRVQCNLNRTLAARSAALPLPTTLPAYNGTQWELIGVWPKAEETWSEALLRVLHEKTMFITNRGLEEATKKLGFQAHMAVDRAGLLCLLTNRLGMEYETAIQVETALKEHSGGLCTPAAVVEAEKAGFLTGEAVAVLHGTTYNCAPLVSERVARGCEHAFERVLTSPKHTH